MQTNIKGTFLKIDDTDRIHVRPDRKTRLKLNDMGILNKVIKSKATIGLIGFRIGKIALVNEFNEGDYVKIHIKIKKIKFANDKDKFHAYIFFLSKIELIS
jgi:hypothetical protein